MNLRFLTSVLSAAGFCVLCGCDRDPQTLTAARAPYVDREVRAFAQEVAQDVSQNGPSAWRRRFSENPAFFMAADGHLQFPDSASATKGIEGLTHAIRHIELKWGDDLRVDPLRADLAVMAASFHEILVNADGSRVDSNGFFTGTTEKRDGEWKFRNAHWSEAIPAAGRQ
jgi:hypothetical protein